MDDSLAPMSILVIQDGTYHELVRNDSRKTVQGGQTLRVFYTVAQGGIPVLGCLTSVVVGFHLPSKHDPKMVSRVEAQELQALKRLRQSSCAHLRHLVAEINIHEGRQQQQQQQQFIVLYESYDGDAFAFLRNLAERRVELKVLRYWLYQAVRALCVQVRTLFKNGLLYTDIKFENLLVRRTGNSEMEFMLCDYTGIRSLGTVFRARQTIDTLPQTRRWVHLSLLRSPLTRESFASLVQHAMAYEYRRFLSSWSGICRVPVSVPFIEASIATDVTPVVVQFLGPPRLDLMCSICVDSGRVACSCNRTSRWTKATLPVRHFSSPARLENAF